MVKTRHLLEFIAVRTLYLMFEMMPVRAASDFGGWLAKLIGPLLPVTRIARINLMHVLPDRAAEHGKIIRGMWENFGRVFAEYPHLKTIAAGRGGAKIEIVGMENLHAFRDMARGGIILTGHLANWEFGTYTARTEGFSVHVVYRPPNNPLVDRLLSGARSGGAVSSIQKGAEGAKDIIRYIKSKEFIAMLMDQKMNDGTELDFMGKPAMTATAPAGLAIRYQVPIILVIPERISGIHFRWHISAPFLPAPDAKAVEVTAQLNHQLGEWVRARPHQWLWIHRRWKI